MKLTKEKFIALFNHIVFPLTAILLSFSGLVWWYSDEFLFPSYADTSIFTCAYYVITIGTVGFGDIVPISDIGRFILGLLAITSTLKYGLAVSAVVSLGCITLNNGEND